MRSAVSLLESEEKRYIKAIIIIIIYIYPSSKPGVWYEYRPLPTKASLAVVSLDEH